MWGSRAALSWVAGMVLHLPKVPEQTLAGRSFLDQVWDTRDTRHRLSSSCPHWDAGAQALLLAGHPGRGYTDVALMEHIEHLSPRQLHC